MAAIRVLLVDDRPDVADLTATYLERVGEEIAVTVEGSAEEGLARLERESFDCVVSDYEMPERDGLEFLADVRERTPDLPFVLFTGKGNEEIASEAISAGVTDYLQKGSGTEQYEVLANRVRNAVSQFRAEREAAEATEQMRRMYSRITDAFYALDEDWTITYVNEQAASFLDRDHTDLEGEDIREAFPEGVGDEFYEAYTEAFETQEPVTLTAESVFQPGRWVEERVFPSEDGLSIYFRDITERRRREQTLNALHGATRELMQAETEREIATIVCRVADTVLEFPGTGVRLYDAEADALVNVAIGGEQTEGLRTSEDEPRESSGSEDADEIERPTFDLTGTPHGRAYREGETVTVEVGEHPDLDLGPFSRTMYVPMGEYGILSVGKHEDEEFTESSVRFAEVLAENARAALDRADRERELREREQALEAQNERLEEFASLVSHDLRNPLNVARGHLAIARETGREENFDRVAAAHDRMGSLIDDLLALARKGQTVGSSETVALADVAERAWRSVATDGAALEVGDPGTVEADADRLCDLFENLFRNSMEHAGGNRGDDADAHDGGGNDDADVHDSGGGDDHGEETVEGDDCPLVRVIDSDEGCGFAVEDDGPGIPEAEREQVFEYGYSTEEEGIGLGLAIVKGVADAHGWSVEVGESEAGGARFVFEVE